MQDGYPLKTQEALLMPGMIETRAFALALLKTRDLQAI
jgi:hypothetical protein